MKLKLAGDKCKHPYAIWMRLSMHVLRWRLHTVDDDMKERLNRPKYIDCGPGKCGSTVVIQDGCKKAIVPREELLGKRKWKWAELSSSKKQMPFNEDNKICSRCYIREVRLSEQSSEIVSSPSSSSPLLNVTRNKEIKIIASWMHSCPMERS